MSQATGTNKNTLDAQVDAFLTKGGTIQQIPTGTTGMKPKGTWAKGTKTAPTQPSTPTAAVVSHPRASEG